ncbi:hypothetical protein K502DRAFT_364986 [Neoconidiobolus thromboides FSU 785]|nr:hypothetical protein K502DRAFT_364986 [Neoconidiobolus thromboides FSU 785]
MDESPPPSFMYSVTVVYPTLSSMSAVLASLVVLTMIILSLYDFKLVNRVSLRLQTAVSALDIWTHTTALWFPLYNESASAMCTFIAWQRQFGPLIYLFLNISVATNLLLVFIKEARITKTVEIAYWVAPIIGAAIITIPPLAIGLTGFGDFNNCYFTPQDEKTYQIADMLISNMWYLLTLVYCTAVVAMVVFKLRKDIEQLKVARKFVFVKDTKTAIKKANMFVNRILLYPIVAIISVFGVSVSQIYILVNGGTNFGIDIWAMNGLALSGTLNFIAFVCDPTLHSAFYAIYKRFILKSAANIADTESVGDSGTYSLNVPPKKLDSTFQLTMDDEVTVANPNDPEYTKEIEYL